MGRLNLKAEDSTSEVILNYLEANVSDELANKINNGDKTLSQCFNYIKTEAKKEAVNGCACISDATVFGWAIHFFEEDAIKGEGFAKGPAVAVATKTTATAEKVSIPVSEVEAKKKAPKKAKADTFTNVEQIGFDFGLFGGSDGTDEA